MLSNYFSSAPLSTLYNDPETLAVIEFNTDCIPSQDGTITCGLKTLSGAHHEVWRVHGETIISGHSKRCQWRRSNEILCTAIWLSPEECIDIESSTQAAYTEILNCLTEQGYPYPFRFWNYIPSINQGEGDDEEYKKFCSGRLHAFNSSDIPEENFPAASALGHHAQGAVVYVLSSKHSGLHHKNKLQIDAYNYPRQYGINSPSFARATSITLEKQDLFFISGTASIIGHKTIAVGDINGQLETTAKNIQHLIEHAKKEGCSASLQTLKVYIRHQSDLAVCKNFLDTHYPSIPVIFLHADVCRESLLVEIECFFG